MRAAQPIGCAAIILRASQEYPSSVQIRSQAGIEMADGGDKSRKAQGQGDVFNISAHWADLGA